MNKIIIIYKYNNKSILNLFLKLIIFLPYLFKNKFVILFINNNQNNKPYPIILYILFF